MTEPVGVVGLGIMGGTMARRLLADGIPVFGFDPSEAAAQTFAAAGGQLAASAADVATAADIVLTSLPTAGALAGAVGGPGGIHEAARPGLVVVEMSTLALADKEAARRTLASSGATMLDCPVSGTGAQAKSGDLTFFASGEPDAIAQVQPVLERLGRRVHAVGAFGAGSRLKYIANLLVGIHNVAAAEAFVLAEKAGLDTRLVYEVLADSAGASRIFQLRVPLMIEGRYEPPTTRLETFVKDLDVITAFADDVGSPVALLNVVRDLYTTALASGMGELDSAAVCAVIEQMAGVRRAADS